MSRNTINTVERCDIYPEEYGVRAQFINDGEELGNKQKIQAKEGSRSSEILHPLTQQFGILYLISQNFPQIIHSPNLDFHNGIVQMIDAMYAHYGFSPPTIEADNFSGQIVTPSDYNLSPEKAAVLYSGGKDSMWVYWKLIQNLGKDNVLPIHIRNLNKGVGSEEWKAVLRQNHEIGLNLNHIDLTNSSKVSGKAVMNARDFLMMSLAIPSSLSFGATRMLTEGGMLDEKNNSAYGFSSGSASWKLYEEVIGDMGVETRPDWYPGDTDFTSMQELFENNPGWMPLVNNCFTSVQRRKAPLTRWKREMPDWVFYDDGSDEKKSTQCGSCIKCRSMGIARLLWDESVQDLPVDQAMFMINDNKKWIIEKRDDYADMGVMDEFEHWISEAEKKWSRRVGEN